LRVALKTRGGHAQFKAPGKPNYRSQRNALDLHGLSVLKQRIALTRNRNPGHGIKRGAKARTGGNESLPQLGLAISTSRRTPRASSSAILLWDVLWFARNVCGWGATLMNITPAVTRNCLNAIPSCGNVDGDHV
jgi:hypothetical protein